MHARPMGWQSLAVIAMALLTLVASVVGARADAEPSPGPRAKIDKAPAVAERGARRRAQPMVDDITSARYDVADVAVPGPQPTITVAYTVEHRGSNGEAEILTTRVADAAHAEALVDELQTRPRVAAAEIDTVFAALGGDPERGRQWGLDLLRAERVWEHGNACGQTIAVVDSGVDGDHPDLQGIVRTGKNLVSRGIGAADRSGHGTEVAGIAAAATGNGEGIAGMAPGARILPIGIEDAAGQMHASDLAQAIKYAIEHEATVINLSLGGPVRSENVEYWLGRADDAGIPVVASAGNAHDNQNPTIWPAASPSVIAVAAVAPTGVWAPFSSTGEYVDLAAPGVAVLTTARDGGYVAGNGTSLSAPFVSATAAMLRARRPRMRPASIRRLLVSQATDYGDEGWDPRFGHGVVDPLATLKAAGGARTDCFSDTDDLTLGDEIERLALAGVTDGCAAGRFCPAQAVTRGQMATFLSRAIGQTSTDADFFDDDDGSEHEPGINRLAQANIARGCTTSRFCPNDPVTRGQMAAFIARALDLPAVRVDAFDDDGGQVHESSINALAAVGITGGCDAGSPERFCPDDTVSRAQMAAFLVRMMDRRAS